MLRPRSSKRQQRVLHRIIPLRHRDPPNRIRHLLHRQRQQIPQQLLLLHLPSHRFHQLTQPPPRRRHIQWNRRPLRIKSTHQQIHIRHRQRPASPVTCRPRIRSRALRSHSQPRRRPSTNRSPTRRHRLNRHTRRQQLHPRHPLHKPIPRPPLLDPRHIRARPSHVQRQHPLKSHRPRRRRRTHRPTRRPADEQILRPHLPRRFQPPRTRHHLHHPASQRPRHPLHKRLHRTRQQRVRHHTLRPQEQLRKRRHLA